MWEIRSGVRGGVRVDFEEVMMGREEEEEAVGEGDGEVQQRKEGRGLGGRLC